MDGKMTVIGGWGSPTDPSPRTLVNFLNDEFGSRPFHDLLLEGENQKLTEDGCSEDGFNFSSDVLLEPISFGGQKSSSRGGLAQRIARAGFSAPTINTAEIKSANMASSSSEVRSPYLTIPPGLSPTTLLESPVFLSNSMAHPSPTTGKFSFLCNGSSLISASASVSAVPDGSKDNRFENIASGGFAFRPPLNMTSSYFPSLESKDTSAAGCQPSLQNMDCGVKNGFRLPAGLTESSGRKDSTDDSTICPRPIDSFVSNEQSPSLEDQADGGDTKRDSSSMSVTAPEEDGYNWRKYGQKQVKGSEFPRSYYKCTHPNCEVKKKVERSHEGHITEIIYKGAHNHAKPLPNRRSGMLPANIFNDAQMDGLEGGSGPHDGRASQWAGDGMDTSSASIAAEFVDPSASVDTHARSHVGSPEAIEVSSTVSNEEEEGDQATHGSASLGVDGEGDENESKRRKLDACAAEMHTGSRAVREPRVVVQTTSEVDILDDGYRWRKYGQKVVKGNPNPRSYYKCTYPGCTVRKHVERASHDLNSVITTYEGKHNHDVPAARNNSHSNSGASTTAAALAGQPHPLHRRPELAQDSLMHFNGPPPLSAFSFHGREQQLGLGPGFSFRIGQPGLVGNLVMGGLGSRPIHGPVHSYVGQQASNGNAGFMVPKGEPKEEPVSEPGLHIPYGVGGYHQLLSRLPLGPQL